MTQPGPSPVRHTPSRCWASAKRYGEVQALADRGPGHRAGRVRGAAGSVRLRQEHDAQDHRRPRGRDRRRGLHRRTPRQLPPPRDRDVAMVFQNYALYPHMTVATNIGFPLAMRRHPKAEVAARVAEVAALLELDDQLDKYPDQLSGGQRQRVALGRAIIREPVAFLHGRAAVQSRRPAAGPDAHRAAEAPPARRADHGVRDPRPGGGDDDGRPDRGHARRLDPADRHPGRGLRAARDDLRGHVRGQSADEPVPGPVGRHDHAAHLPGHVRHDDRSPARGRSHRRCTSHARASVPSTSTSWPPAHPTRCQRSSELVENVGADAYLSVSIGAGIRMGAHPCPDGGRRKASGSPSRFDPHHIRWFDEAGLRLRQEAS